MGVGTLGNITHFIPVARTKSSKLKGKAYPSPVRNPLTEDNGLFYLPLDLGNKRRDDGENIICKALAGLFFLAYV